MKFQLAFILLIVSNFLQAKTIWSDFSVSLLKGNKYEVGDSNRKVVTFEYTSGNTWGGQFLFFDRLESSNGDNETYGEWSPKIIVSELDAGIIKNLYLSSTIEAGVFSGTNGFSNSFTNYLVGVGSDLNIPKFSYASVNFYHRNNEQSDNGYQMTFVWGVPIGPLFYDGFMDLAMSTSDNETSMNITSQLKYDISQHLNLDSKLYVGVEYVYWQNKFGIEGIDEKNVNLLLKYHF